MKADRGEKVEKKSIKRKEESIPKPVPSISK